MSEGFVANPMAPIPAGDLGQHVHASFTESTKKLQAGVLRGGGESRDSGGELQTSDHRQSTIGLVHAPRMRPLQTLQLVAITSVFYAALVMAFSVMGFGDDIHRFLQARRGLSSLAMFGGVLGTFVLYITDVSDWPRGGFAHDRVKPLATAAVLACLAVGGVLMAETFPAAPLAVFLCVLPALCRKLKTSLFKGEHLDRFIGSVAVALGLESVACMGAWLLWVFHGKQWNSGTKVHYADAMNCEVLCLKNLNHASAPPCMLVSDLLECDQLTNGTFFRTKPLNASVCGDAMVGGWKGHMAAAGLVTASDCEAIYVVWFAPAICAIIGVIFSLFSHGLARSLRQHKGNFAGRLFLGLFFLTMVGLWVAANIATAEMELIGTMYAFVLSTFVIIGLVLNFTIGFGEMRKQMMAIPLFSKMASVKDSPWLQSMGVIAGAPAMGAYLALSATNQMVRRSGWCPVSAPPFRVPPLRKHQNAAGKPFDESDHCYECNCAFTRLNRRHHCRVCCHSFCGEHSAAKVQETVWQQQEFKTESVRACKRCAGLEERAKQEAASGEAAAFVGGGGSGGGGGGGGVGGLGSARTAIPVALGGVGGETDEWVAPWVTAKAHAQLCAIFGGTDARGEKHPGWMWTSVLQCVVWWGVILITLVVGIGKVVTISLSMLNTQLESVPLGATTGIFFFIGLGMFLLPPVPGVPVYFTGGVILVKSAEPVMGFGAALGFTIGICFLIKLCAIAIQQKAIGEGCGANSVWVRNVVGVNSLSIRAIKLILERPGLNLSKCAILCGGPDWPTSVLTGILRLSLPQMLVGSVPVLLLLAPCVCGGAFMLKVKEGDSWRSLSSVTLAIAAIVQTSALVAAAYYIEAEAAAHAEQLRALPRDEAVHAISERKRVARAKYREVTHWSNLPRWWRAVLLSASVLMLGVIYLVQGFSSKCFEVFEVTDKIKVQLRGDARNVLKPMGVMACWVFLASCVLLWYFQRWAKGLVGAHGAVLDGKNPCAAGDAGGGGAGGGGGGGGGGADGRRWREQILKERGAVKPGTAKAAVQKGKHHAHHVGAASPSSTPGNAGVVGNAAVAATGNPQAQHATSHRSSALGLYLGTESSEAQTSAC